MSQVLTWYSITVPAHANLQLWLFSILFPGHRPPLHYDNVVQGRR